MQMNPNAQVWQKLQPQEPGLQVSLTIVNTRHSNKTQTRKQEMYLKI